MQMLAAIAVWRGYPLTPRARYVRSILSRQALVAVGLYLSWSVEVGQVLGQLDCLQWVGKCRCRLCCASCMHVISCYP